MTYDQAMLEALEEVDRIGWAAPPVAPPRRDPLNTGLAMMQGQFWEVQCSAAEMQYAIRFTNAAGLSDSLLLANQAGRESIEAALRLRGTR
jgi:hypothetical protein